jgi:hydrogenase maturation protease
MCNSEKFGVAAPATQSFENVNKTLVLGMGNPILGDDGVGVRVAAELQKALPVDATVDVSEACVGGLSLMERMVGYDTVILIDALTLGTVRPGTIHRMTLNELAALGTTQHIASAHDTNLLTALEAGGRMSLPLPHTVTIFAIEARNVLDFGYGLTPDVAAAVPHVVEDVLNELDIRSGTAQDTDGRMTDGLT